MHGLVHALLIWAYESFPALGEVHGRKKAGDEVPLVSWGGSRKRITVEEVIEAERKAHGKVCQLITLAELIISGLVELY